MAPPQKPEPSAPPATEGIDLLALLQSRRVLNAEQAERVRRSAKMNKIGVERMTVCDALG